MRFSTDRKIVGFSVLVLLVFLVTSWPHASVAAQSTLTDQQIAAVKKISKFINGFRTIQGEFTQTSPRGAVSQGVLYLQKSGKMRFEYAAPNPFVIVSDGNWVTMKNRSKDSAEQYPLSKTPLRLILSDKIDILKEAKILNVEETPELITVTLEDRKNAVPGQLVLVFDKGQNALRQWVVVDEKGRRTTVELKNLTAGVKIDPALFTIAVKRSTSQGKKSDR